MFKTNVKTIVGGFQKTIDKLRAHANTMADRQFDISTKIHNLENESRECTAEMGQASNIADKLEAIISADE